MQIRNIKFNWKIALIIGLIITLFSGCEVKAADYSSTVQLRSYSLAEMSTVLSLLTDEDINLSEYSNTSEFNTWILKENCGKFIFSYRSSATSTEILPAFLFTNVNNTAQWRFDYQSSNDIQILQPFMNRILNKMFVIDIQNKRINTIDYPANYLNFQNIDVYCPLGYKLKLSSSGVNSEEFFSVDYQKRMFFEFINWYSGPWYGVENATSSSYTPLTSEPLNANEIQEPEILPDTIDSVYGYLWSPSAEDVEINLDYKDQNQLIHGEHFIGKDLKSSFVFYYYSGDDIVSFNDYVTRNAYLSTDYGTWYDFYISPENLEYLPNNTNFYLNIYATLNDNTATVVKDFLAFHTVDNSSGGDTSGDVPDTEIQNSLNNIENKIPSSGDIQNVVSQETDKIINFMSGDADFKNENISSGDIIGSIGYEPPDDPYANFWWELTEILNNALTGTNRTLTLKAIKNTYTISIDDIAWNPPDVLRTFLTLLSTTVVCWVLIKYIKITIDKLSSGSIDEALAMNEECGIVDLF